MSSSRNNMSLRRLAEWLVETGKKEGAEEVEAAISESNHLDIDIRWDRIENLTRAVSRRLSFKVLKDQRSAVSGTSDLSRQTLNEMVKRAVKRAEFSQPDPFAGLPETSPVPDASALNLYDPEIEEVTPDSAKELARETEKRGMEDPRISNSLGSSFESQESRVILANSKGFSEEYKETFFHLGLGLQAGKGDNRVEGYWSSSTRFRDELESPAGIAAAAVNRTVRLMNPKKIRTCNVPVVFEPRMTSWLLGFLFTCVSGTAVYNQASFLSDQRRERIAGSDWTVVDDGVMPGKIGSAPFDSEGVPCRKTPVVHEGILRNFLCNTYAARKLNLASTGNAHGNGVGPNNFYLTNGKKTPDEIIASLDKGLILVRTIGHGLNPVTGDISRGAYGLWVEKGEILHPVSEITIAGNLGKILKQPVLKGNDLRFRSSLSGPTLRIEEMTLAGE